MRDSDRTVLWRLKKLLRWKKYNRIARVRCTAIFHGHFECVKYLHRHGILDLDVSECVTIVGSGNIECLKFIHEQGAFLCDSCLGAAAFCGHFECLMYLHQHLENGDISESICHTIRRRVGGQTEMNTGLMNCFVFCLHTTPYLQDHKVRIHRRLKERMDIIREELMAVTWAPKRMAAWCLPYDDEFHSM